jgi:hypothetical protein
MDVLTLDDFSCRLGEGFEVAAAEGGTIVLELATAQPLAAAMREGGGFRLEWLGPREPMLAQGTHRMRAGTAEFEIFIVPIGRGEAGTTYEAIFN